jgi:hypothetical protein
MSEEQDWRLTAALEAAQERAALGHLVGRLRGPHLLDDVEAAVSADVVITHDGKRLFAYAATESALAEARRAIESVLRSDGATASILVSRWDRDLDEWRQTDPPLTGEAKRTQEAAESEAEATDTRTLVASVGKLIRSEFDATMRDWAERLGLQYTLIEHRHLLSTQVAFTVSGPRRKIDEFVDGLRAEEIATMRTERAVMLSPL